MQIRLFFQHYRDSGFVVIIIIIVVTNVPSMDFTDLSLWGGTMAMIEKFRKK